jgi:hypothetical protein
MWPGWTATRKRSADSGNPEFAYGPGSATLLKSPSQEVHADVAQLVEHHLAKVRVAGSNPVVRSVFLTPLRRSGRVA